MSNSENNLINQIKDLKKKLSFMEVMRGEKFDVNELDYARLQVDLEKSRRASKTVEKRHNLLFNQPFLGVVYFDVDRTIIDCNEKFTKIIGYSREIIVGHNILNIFDDKNIMLAIMNSFKGESSSFQGGFFNRIEKKNILLKGYFLTESNFGKTEEIYAGIFEDVTSLQSAEFGLKLAQKAFSNISYPIIISDKEGKIKFVNSEFCKLYGYSKEEIYLENIKILRSLNNPKKVNDAIYNRSISEDIWSGEVLNIKKNGQEFPVFLSTDTIAAEDNKIFARIFIIRDITDDKNFQKEISTLKIKAEHSEKMKAQFLNQMSHEIRTPINVILNISKMILEEKGSYADEERTSSLSLLNSAGKRILRTVDLILNMSEIQSGGYFMTNKKFDLFAEMYNNFDKTYSRQALEKDLELKWKRKTSNCVVFADFYSVSQIFENIINNGLQFTHIGGLEIIFSRNKDEKLEVQFKDSGIGINENFLPNIFDAFSQEETGHTRRYEGNGLGLALVKGYCDINNIHISVESNKGIGSTFTLIFN